MFQYYNFLEYSSTTVFSLEGKIGFVTQAKPKWTFLLGNTLSA